MKTIVETLMSTAQGVVFDKDGTLIDLDARWVPVFAAFMTGLVERCDDPSLIGDLAASLGIDGDRLVPDGPAAVDTIAQIIDRSAAELVTHGHEPAVAQQIVDATVRDLGEMHGPITPIGDLAGALMALRSAGLRIGVATSDDRANTIAELTDLGVIDLVDTLRCADDGGPTKPDPRVLTGIAVEWGLDVGELVFVGDSANDMATARSAGCPFVARFGTGPEPTWATDADAVIASIEQLVLT